MMIDRTAEISRLYGELNSGSKFMAKRSIFALGEAIDSQEPIRAILACWYKNWSGALCTTDRQIVFMQKPLLGRKSVERFPFELITSVEHKSFLGLAELIIHSGGKSAKVSRIEIRDLGPFMKAFDDVRSSKGRAHAGSSFTGEMERLAALMEQGHLTTEEFAMAKQRLLS